MPHRLHPQVAARARYHCEYCQAPERISPDRFQVEHIVPRSLGGSDDLANLALSCPPCNRRKSRATHAIDPTSEDRVLVPLFNPRTDIWYVHFRFYFTDESVQILGRTPIGRATVVRLAMNDEHVAQARAFWVLAGMFPP